MSAIPDCQGCGACCCNPPSNVAEDFRWYVEIDDPRSALLLRTDLRKRYVIHDPDGIPHLRLQPDGRCAALRGKLAGRVECLVYPHRPRACRRVEAGTVECEQARIAMGLPPR